MDGLFEQRLKYKVCFVILPSFSSDLSLGVTYDEDDSVWQDGNEVEVDYSRNFLLDCSREKAEEILSFLFGNRFFWYERYPKYYKAEWKKHPASFRSRLRRRFYRAWQRRRH